MKGLFVIAARTASLLTLLLLTVILFIRARPYDSDPVLGVLLPTGGCEKPCIWGFRPGQTGLAEVVAFFEQRPSAHFVVQHTARDMAGEIATMLHWREDGSKIGGSMTFISGTLVQANLEGFQLYEIWLALGEPQGGHMVIEERYIDEQRAIQLPIAHIVYYEANHLLATTSSTCKDFWQQAAYIFIRPPAAPDTLGSVQSLPDQRRLTCERWRAYEQAVREG